MNGIETHTIYTSVGGLDIVSLDKFLNEYIEHKVIDDKNERIVVQKQIELTFGYVFNGFPTTEQSLTYTEHRVKKIHTNRFKYNRFLDYFLKKQVEFFVKETEIQDIEELSLSLLKKANIGDNCCLIELKYGEFIYFIILSKETFQFFSNKNNTKGELVLINDSKWVVFRSDKELDFNKLYTSQRYYSVV